jgi:hypothetical protein
MGISENTYFARVSSQLFVQRPALVVAKLAKARVCCSRTRKSPRSLWRGPQKLVVARPAFIVEKTALDSTVNHPHRRASAILDEADIERAARPNHPHRRASAITMVARLLEASEPPIWARQSASVAGTGAPGQNGPARTGASVSQAPQVGLVRTARASAAVLAR